MNQKKAPGTLPIDTALDQYARAQLQMICDNESSSGCLIRVMPDVHPGKIGTIGLTITIGDRIIPNLIGIDIGCGMTLAEIKRPDRVKSPPFSGLL